MSSRSVVLLVVATLACATTQVSDGSSTWQGAKKPERIVVQTFATSPDEVQLDHSPTAVAAWKLEHVTASEEEQKVARDVANALADALVKEIQKLGLPAERATDAGPTGDVPTLIISGHFLSIDEGSRTERVVIGLGAGRSDVRTAVHVIERLPEASRVLDTFEVEAKSGSTPGMAETMGAGAAAGHLATSAAVGVAKSAASEKFGDDVEADAQRTAKKIADLLATTFRREGWIPPAD